MWSKEQPLCDTSWLSATNSNRRLPRVLSWRLLQRRGISDDVRDTVTVEQTQDGHNRAARVVPARLHDRLRQHVISLLDYQPAWKRDRGRQGRALLSTSRYIVPKMDKYCTHGHCPFTGHLYKNRTERYTVSTCSDRRYLLGAFIHSCWTKNLIQRGGGGGG